jgi:hypothetical protein
MIPCRLQLLVLTTILTGCATHRATDAISMFTGTWHGVGTFQKMPSKVDARFTSDGPDNLSLTINIVATPANGKSIAFTGNGRYQRQGNQHWIGNWSDSTGAAYGIQPTFTQGALVVDWGPDAPVRGRSEYQILSSGQLQIDDYVPRAPNDLQLFATATLQRVP